jgi:Sulfotransferase family
MTASKRCREHERTRTESDALTKTSLERSEGNSLIKFPCFRISFIFLLIAALCYHIVWVDVASIDLNGELGTAENRTAASAELLYETCIDSSIGSDANVNGTGLTESPPPSLGKDVPQTLPSSKKQDEQTGSHPLHKRDVSSKPILDYLEQELLSNAHQPLGNTTVYQQQHCNLQGRPWCPTGRNKWQRRAPHFMILGVKKAGSSSLYFALTQHPNIVSAQRKELLFFSQKRFLFDKYLSSTDNKGDPRDKHLINTTHVVNVQTIREDLTKKFRIGDLLKDPQTISFDATPQYIFNFPTAVRPILCTCPWVKLIVIIRNPVDRLWSHYNFLKGLQMKNNGGNSPSMKMSFEDWVVKDLERMEKHGLLSKNSTDLFALDEQAMLQSWHDYTADFFEGPLGRGLYALQLYQWMKELRRFGREPKHAMKVVRLEDLKAIDHETESEIPQHILQELADWLLLDGRDTDNMRSNKGVKKHVFRQHMGTRYDKLGDPILSNRTREWLDAFYAPHNKMLAELLGDESWDYSNHRENVTPNSHSFRKIVVWPRHVEGDLTPSKTREVPLFLTTTNFDIASNDPCYYEGKANINR